MTANNQNLPRQIADAVLWAAFFICAPFFEFIVLGVIVWLPLFGWRERVRSARYGYLPGAMWRFGVIGAMITLAALAPAKHEDRRIGPLQHASVTLADLAAAKVIYPLHEPQDAMLRIALPSATPTRREVMAAITNQTDLHARIYHCAHGATILFGNGGGLISVSKKPSPGS